MADQILRRSGKRGFSLTELLVVVSIMGMLAAVSMASLQGLAKSSNVTAAGNVIVDMANQARQNATTKGASTALVIITKASADSTKSEAESKIALRTFCLMQYTATATNSQWQMLTRWQTLPPGVQVDTNSSTFLTSPTLTTGSVSAKLFSKSYVSQSSADMLSFQVFSADGSLNTGGAAKRLRIVSEKGTSPSIYDIFFSPYTGSTKVFRTGDEDTSL